MSNEVHVPTDESIMTLLTAIRNYDNELHEREIPRVALYGDGSGSISYRQNGSERRLEYAFLGVDEAIAWLRSDSKDFDNE